MYNISLSTLTGGSLPNCVRRHLFRVYVRCSPEGGEPHYHSLLDVGRGQVMEDFQLENETMGPHSVEYLSTEMWTVSLRGGPRRRLHGTVIHIMCQ